MNTLSTCWKCAGSGHLDWAKHIANGVCFVCKGKGEYTVHQDKRTGTVSLAPDPKVVWQFLALKRDSTGQPMPTFGSKVEPDYVIVQAVSGNGRKGTTHLSCAVQAGPARRLYKRLEAGEAVAPDSLTPADLGLIEGYQWTFEDGSPVVGPTRNRGGMRWL